MNPIKPYFKFLLLILFTILGENVSAAEDSAWVKLFNGKDLNDWDIHFSTRPFNENYYNTFKVANGILTVDYSEWKSNYVCGHAANKLRPYSYYWLRSEYQVLKDGIPGTRPGGNPGGWAFENNGLMLHSQSMASMGPMQDYPISLEAQLLGPGNKNTTMNLCTPGTAFYTDSAGTQFNGSHCVDAMSPQKMVPEDTGWLNVSALVLGDSVIRFYVDNKEVFKFYHPVYWNQDNTVGDYLGKFPAEKTPLSSGYIAIQAESAPYRFRKLDILDLVGCMDKSKSAYRSYFVKNDPALCGSTSIIKNLGQEHFKIFQNSQMIWSANNAVFREIRDVNGSLIASYQKNSAIYSFRPKHIGIYLITLEKGNKLATQRISFF